MVNHFGMHIFNSHYLYRLDSLLLLLGVALLLLFLGALGVGWFDRGTYLLTISVLLIVLALVFIAARLRLYLVRMIQLNRMEKPEEVQHTDEKLVSPPSTSPKEEGLSKEKARVWLDEFLVEQQKK